MDNTPPVGHLLESDSASPMNDTEPHAATQGCKAVRAETQAGETTAARVSVRRSPYWRWAERATPLQRHAAFFFSVFLLITLALSVLQSLSGALQGRATLPPARTASASPSPQGQMTPTTANAAVSNATVRQGQVRVYAVNDPNAGLMQPAVDQQGSVWVGEMGTNRLARLEPRTGAVTLWEPPNGQHTLMASAIDQEGNVWFTEQAANYIGRFAPATQSFRVFPIDQLEGRNAGPQDLQFDTSGNLWFTLLTGGGIGRLDPATGAIQTWPVPAPQAGGKSYPFAITLTPDGQVWFGLLSGGAVGTLDPATGKVTLIHLADPTIQIFSMASDTAGHVWFTELNAAKLGMVETASGAVTEVDVPTLLGSPRSLYDVTVAANGAVWFASAGANALVRYVPATHAFTLFQIPQPASVPYGLALDRAGVAWFTAAGQPRNYIGQLTPDG